MLEKVIKSALGNAEHQQAPAIDDLVVVDDEGRIAGTVDIQDLPKLKIL